MAFEIPAKLKGETIAYLLVAGRYYCRFPGEEEDAIAFFLDTLQGIKVREQGFTSLDPTREFSRILEYSITLSSGHSYFSAFFNRADLSMGIGSLFDIGVIGEATEGAKRIYSALEASLNSLGVVNEAVYSQQDILAFCTNCVIKHAYLENKRIIPGYF